MPINRQNRLFSFHEAVARFHSLRKDTHHNVRDNPHYRPLVNHGGRAAATDVQNRSRAQTGSRFPYATPKRRTGQRKRGKGAFTDGAGKIANQKKTAGGRGVLPDPPA